MVGGRQPLVEDNLQWKTTFGGRWPLMEDTFGGRQTSVEDDLWGKTTFGGRQPLLKDDLRWKTTFSERRPVVEDDLQWKTTFSGRRPLLDPCMLPTPLCGIFWKYPKFYVSFFRDSRFEQSITSKPSVPSIGSLVSPLGPPSPTPKFVSAIILVDVIYEQANMIMIKVYFCTPQLYFGAYILIRG